MSKAIYGNKNKFINLIKNVSKKSEKIEDFSSIRDELRIIINLSKDFVSGRYKGVSKKSMIMIIAAFLYLINPMDIVPDILVGVGFLDDLSVFTYLIAKIKLELDKYEEWALNNQH